MFKLIIVGLLSSLCFGVAVGLDMDPLLDSLSGEHGGNLITLCMRSGTGTSSGSGSGSGTGTESEDATRSCRGALAHPRLVVVRASCLHNQPMRLVHMFPTAEDFSCDDPAVLLSNKMRRVAQRFIHPSYDASPSQNDLALVGIYPPYNMDKMKYSNNTYSLLQKFNPWIHHMMELHQPAYTREHRHTSPEKLFLMAVLMPFILFIIFFLYVTSGTTQPDHLEDRTL